MTANNWNNLLSVAAYTDGLFCENSWNWQSQAVTHSVIHMKIFRLAVWRANVPKRKSVMLKRSDSLLASYQIFNERIHSMRNWHWTHPFGELSHIIGVRSMSIFDEPLLSPHSPSSPISPFSPVSPVASCHSRHFRHIRHAYHVCHVQLIQIFSWVRKKTLAFAMPLTVVLLVLFPFPIVVNVMIYETIPKNTFPCNTFQKE